MRGHGLMQAIARVNRVFKDETMWGSSKRCVRFVQADRRQAAEWTESDEQLAEFKAFLHSRGSSFWIRLALRIATARIHGTLSRTGIFGTG